MAVQDSMPESRGVYFLANDDIIDLVIAFLNSFRRSNPSLPLCLIPFDSKISRLIGLRDIYSFTLFDHTQVLARCDEISIQFHGRVRGHYRKLAIWEGGFDHFLFIDCDTVTLRNLEFALDYLTSYAFVAPHSNISSHRRFVWKDSIYETCALTNRQIDWSANTGFLGSRKDVLSLEKINAQLPGALALAPHMELRCSEQPLLNYLMVTSDEPRTSLLALGETQAVPQFHQAGFPLRPEIAIVHWAGMWNLSRTEARVRRVLDRLHVLRSLPRVRFFLPHKRLWNSYRFMQPSREPVPKPVELRGLERVD